MIPGPSEHRRNTSRGLQTLARFLEAEYGNAHLNEASRTEIQYCVLEKDPWKARKEYEEARDHLKQFHDLYWGAKFAEPTRLDPANRAIQHVAELSFGDNTVVYSVLWIEKEVKTDA